MNTPTVREIMVPLAQYATVSDDATLGEAVRTLEEAQRNFDQSRYRHRAVLVLDKNGSLVGKLSQHDVLRALEPNYHRLSGIETVSRFGWSPQYLESIAREYGLWAAPLERLCMLASNLRVKEIMHSPEEGEYIQQDAPVTQALDHFVMGCHHSLLVTAQQHEIVGVLRLTDIFALVCKMLESCGSQEQEDSPASSER